MAIQGCCGSCLPSGRVQKLGQLTSSEDVQVKLSIHFLANQVIFGSNFGDDTVCACRFPFPKGFM